MDTTVIVAIVTGCFALCGIFLKDYLDNRKKEAAVSNAEKEPPKAENKEVSGNPTEKMPTKRDIPKYGYAYSDAKKDLSVYTQKEFAQIIEERDPRDYFPLGTKIKMCVNSTEITDTSIEFELVAYRHFRLADGTGMAKSTWLMVNLLNEKREMNSSRTNAGGWANSEMREWLNEKLYPTLPTHWKKWMKEVCVLSTAGNASSEIVMSKDFLFLPSAGEVDTDWVKNSSAKDYYISEIDAQADENTFAHFQNYADRIKRSGRAAYWWLRSPVPGSSSGFNYVGNVGYSSSSNAGTSYGVCSGFCL